jgi:hypothetical protein
VPNRYEFTPQHFLDLYESITMEMVHHFTNYPASNAAGFDCSDLQKHLPNFKVFWSQQAEISSKINKILFKCVLSLYLSVFDHKHLYCEPTNSNLRIFIWRIEKISISLHNKWIN